MNALVKSELDNLQLQFPNQSQIDLDQYSQLYGITRRNASRHLRRRKIPATKEGKGVYISILDLAVYKAKCKVGTDKMLILQNNTPNDMKSRRGFNQATDKRAFNI